MTEENVVRSYSACCNRRGKRNTDDVGTSFRFLLKQVRLTTRPGISRSATGTTSLVDGGEGIEYEWEFYGLHSVWAKLSDAQHGMNAYCQVLLCFDFVEEMRRRIIEAFEVSDGHIIGVSPFGIHKTFLETLVIRYDTALWGFRSPVRNYEQVIFQTIRYTINSSC